ncbi:hypothetical protein [Cryptosporangium aurantiacum]|uniref:Uncharacterized protein n=1 Tax=Cryptosporangium aurantiacum TaxID=134849 RepID=A0A1M7PAS3_9ACTN|nr:hypothetical protein [Cryptosporangium aurantiacum]SHN13598.1 hypothetical protein SAMN05443668_103107 [Cryptosporangium aurantiacum]
MIDRRSRYATTPVVPVDDEWAGSQPLLALRATPASNAVLSIQPTDTDRLDLLAWRFYRDPTRFWRICDAATEPDPFDVVVPSEPISIPPDR